MQKAVLWTLADKCQQWHFKSYPSLSSLLFIAHCTQIRTYVLVVVALLIIVLNFYL